MRIILPATLAMVVALPAFSEVIPLKEGDVYCVAYDSKSNSCASVQTLKETGDGEYFMLDLSGFAFGDNNLDMTSTIELEIREERLCVVPDGLSVRITPEDNALAKGWRNLMQYQLNQVVDQGYCFSHEPCGEGWAAIAWVGGERREDMSASFRVFPADDPRSQTVQPRYLGEAELATMQKKMAEQCFPKET